MKETKCSDPSIDTGASGTIMAIQTGRLKVLVERIYESSAFYRRISDGAGIRPEDIRTLSLDLIQA